jgi:hypothetical protein
MVIAGRAGPRHVDALDRLIIWRPFKPMFLNICSTWEREENAFSINKICIPLSLIQNENLSYLAPYFRFIPVML